MLNEHIAFPNVFFDLGSLEWAYTVLANEEGNVTIRRERHQRLRSIAAPLSYTDYLNLKCDIPQTTPNMRLNQGDLGST